MAQDRPPTLPQRDVAAVYRVDGVAAAALPGGVPGPLHLEWDAAGQRLRVSAEGRTQVAIVDLPGRQALIVDAGMRTALALEMKAGALRLDGARFTRQGTDRVVGLACTVYAVQDRQGAGTLCVTADGVPLRGSGTYRGKAGSFTALSVNYAAQPASLFTVPTGYLQLALPSMGGHR